jgi:hypothetical protein
MEATRAQEIDTEQAGLYEAGLKLAQRRGSLLEQLHHAVGDLRSHDGGRGRTRKVSWQLSDPEAVERGRTLLEQGRDNNLSMGAGFIFRTLGQLTEIHEEQRTTAARIFELERIYRADPWSRFFPVVSSPNGHIHSSMNCSTCYPTTGYKWIPSLSGLTMAEAVADQGEYLCSVCFPDAPVRWCRDRSEDRKAEAAAERERRAAAKLVKNLAEAEQFRGYNGDRVTTVAAARQAIRDAVEMRHYSGWNVPHRAYAVAAAEAARTAREVLLARGTGQDEIDTIVKNAERKQRKIWGA